MITLRFRWFALCLLIALFYLQYHLWFASGGVIEVQQLKTSVNQLKAENVALKQKNTTLWMQIDRLKNNHDATEEKARNELGMVKKDETFYQVIR